MLKKQEGILQLMWDNKYLKVISFLLFANRLQN